MHEMLGDADARVKAKVLLMGQKGKTASVGRRAVC
jgi:hypothetical protein